MAGGFTPPAIFVLKSSDAIHQVRRTRFGGTGTLRLWGFPLWARKVRD